MVSHAHLVRNDWNPNVMTAEEEAQLRTEIRKFGFVVPLIVRPHPKQRGRFEIIDGEHRLDVGVSEGIAWFPCWVIDVDDDTARQLTPILNELHGQPDDEKLGALLRDLLSRNPEQDLREVMPFDRQRFDQLIGEMTVDWNELDRVASRDGGTDRWVERVYRMPAEAAQVVDQAIAKAREEAGVDDDWRGLEFIAAEFMGR